MSKLSLFLVLSVFSCVCFAQDLPPQENNQTPEATAENTAEKPAEAAATPPPPPPPAPAKKVPPRVRTGIISSAEFTTEKPQTESNSPAAAKSSSAWAVLTITLDPFRALSIFDYALRKDSTEYPCLDIAEDDTPFNGTQRNYRTPQGGRKYRMLFAIPADKDEYELIFKLRPDEENPVKLNVQPPPPPPQPAAEENKENSENTGAEEVPL